MGTGLANNGYIVYLTLLFCLTHHLSELNKKVYPYLCLLCTIYINYVYNIYVTYVEAKLERDCDDAIYYVKIL